MAKVSGFQSRIIRYSQKGGLILQAYLRGLLMLAILWLTSSPTVIQAHSSGPPRLADAAAGPYRVFVWTQPEPLRVGDAHISILVTRANQPVNDAAVQVEFTPVDQASQAIVVVAHAQDFLSNIYYEADVQLPSTGNWRATINIEGAVGKGSIEFENAVLAKQSLNWPIVGGAAALLVLLVGLMGIWSRMQAQEASPVKRMKQPRPMRTEIK